MKKIVSMMCFVFALTSTAHAADVQLSAEALKNADCPKLNTLKKATYISTGIAAGSIYGSNKFANYIDKHPSTEIKHSKLVKGVAMVSGAIMGASLITSGVLIDKLIGDVQLPCSELDRSGKCSQSTVKAAAAPLAPAKELAGRDTASASVAN